MPARDRLLDGRRRPRGSRRFSDVPGEVLRVAKDHFPEQPGERRWAHPASPLRHQPTHEYSGHRRFQQSAPLWRHFHQVFRDVLGGGAE